MTILKPLTNPTPLTPPHQPPRSISAELDHCNDDKKEIKVRKRRDLVGRGGRGEGGRWATLDAAGRGRERAEGVGEMMQQDSRERDVRFNHQSLHRWTNQPHHAPIIFLLRGFVAVDMMHAFDSQTHPTPLLVYIATSSR